MNKGLDLEMAQSKKIHCKGIPVLISSLILREIGAGQIDMAIWVKKLQELKVYEIKSTNNLSIKQKNRLKKSMFYLAEIFECNVSLDLLVGNFKYPIKFKIM